jgi:hypothetical protein
MSKKLKGIKPPRALKARLKAVGATHKLGSIDDVVYHFVSRGLLQYGVSAETAPEEALERVVDDQGYASRDELIEHLLLRGLDAYEAAVDGPEKLEERLRGLGYIE